MYHLFIEGWGDITYFQSSDWLLAMNPIVGGAVAFIVQLFFAWRLHIIAAQPVLTVFIVVLSLLTFSGAIGTGIIVLVTKEFIYFQRPAVRQITCIWLVSTAVVDVCICAALTYHLRRRRGSYDAADHLLDRIVRCKCLLFFDGLHICMLTASSHRPKWFVNIASCGSLPHFLSGFSAYII